MKICFIGYFKDDFDEGVRNVGKSIPDYLMKAEAHIEIVIKNIDILSIFSTSTLRDIRIFKPDIIHLLISPTPLGLIAAKWVSIMNKDSKIIVSGIHPSIPKTKMFSLLKPHLLLSQSSESEHLFRSLGYATRILPNGVNVEKFKPINTYKKIKLRKNYNVPESKYILLHLASLTKERNLDIFCKLQKINNIQVIIIGRIDNRIEPNVVKNLEDSGCIVWINHFSNIEDIYNLSDCYVFPTIDRRACIETPLSVLEAMACNLPVITTRFGALPNLFRSSDGLIFVDDDDEIMNAINKLQSDEINITTREQVLNYSWNNIIKDLINLYIDLIESEVS